MTKKLEEIFNLPEIVKDDIFEENESVPQFDNKEVFQKTTEILNAISNIEKIDSALTTVRSLDSHDTEMDDIATKALESYDDLIKLGVNVADAHAGRVFEVAAMMLKTAMEAKDAKVSRKLKTIELQIKKARLDLDNKIAEKGKDPSGDDDGKTFDRNELLRIITQSNNNDNPPENNKIP